jgi:predicted aldo/keto reductase-like oxidoreductase
MEQVSKIKMSKVTEMSKATGDKMMQYRTDKKTGNELSLLGFGCMRFPKRFGAIDMQKTEKLLLDAAAGGVNYFDTAYIYPGSEEALGTILAKNNMREKIFVATKLPLVYCNSGADFDKFFDKQLEHLQTNYIDYYLMHMLTDLASWRRLKEWGIEKWIADKKKSGAIRRLGFSFHGMREEFMKILDDYDWDFCQIQYNYSDENYQAGVAGLKKAASKDIPVIIMEPLLGGKLAGGLPGEAAHIFKKANPALSPAAWAFNWLFDQSEITVVLSGMNAPAQLEENLALASAGKPQMLSETDHETFRQAIAAFNASFKIRCTSCAYCMPCPKNVNIPGCFSAYNTSFSMGYVDGMKHYLLNSAATSQKTSGAGLCVKCGACEKHCPQQLPIRANLDLVRGRLEPWWFRCGITLARAVLRKG